MRSRLRISQNALSPRSSAPLALALSLSSSSALLTPNNSSRPSQTSASATPTARARTSPFKLLFCGNSADGGVFGFVVKPEQLCAGLILLVRLETERQVERYKRAIPSRDLLRNIFAMVSAFDLWGEGINSY